MNNIKKYILKNNLKLIYKKNDSELTSICIALDAGAGKERDCFGVAHATEHMVYKGTVNRTEEKINEELNEIFGFQNAMTNYPYAMYYGVLLQENFKRGIELFSDILINPKFSKEGFREEIEIIKQELDEWDEEADQYCEDRLFYNVFQERRIKYPIIGRRNDLNFMTVNHIIKFYKENYFPENTSIVVITNLEFDYIKDIIEEYFHMWKNKYIKNSSKSILYEMPKTGIFTEKKHGMKVCRIEIITPIDKLNSREMKILRIFNEYFGQGVNSILYNNLRTENSMVYDVLTKIQDENYIKLYKIMYSTSKDNTKKTIEIIKNSIEEMGKNEFSNKYIMDKLYKNLKVRKIFNEEKRIVLAKELSSYETMTGDGHKYEEQYIEDKTLTFEEMIEFGKKLLNNLSIQIVQ